MYFWQTFLSSVLALIRVDDPYFEGCFFFLRGIGFSKESASSNHLTSSAEKCLPLGIVSLFKICSVCSSVRTFLLFS